MVLLRNHLKTWGCVLLSLYSWAASDVGRKRLNNEDSYFTDNELGLFMVADGMGGHKAGDKASKIAVESACDSFRANISASLIKDALSQSFKVAAAEVYQFSNKHAEFKGMGTTLSAIAIKEDKAYISHIGDSRIYCFRESSLHQITKDHSLVNEQIEAGLLTKEQARTSSFKNVITRAIGHCEKVRADRIVLSVKPNDLFLLCTDGLTNMLSDGEITDILSTVNKEQVVKELIHQANEKGGDDNITAMLVEIFCKN